jgi:hypothetical protein
MMRNHHAGRIGSCLVALHLIAMVATAAGQTGHSRKRCLAGPLLIEDQGSFFIGGVPKVTPYAVLSDANLDGRAAADPQQITIGQMYVQFQIPVKKYRTRWPVIMVHGASHTGACFESTPDGREGWSPYFVRKGVPVYVVDQSGRGRSGFDASVLHEAKVRAREDAPARAAALMPNFPRITDNGAWRLFFGQLVPPASTILLGRLVPHGSAGDAGDGSGTLPAAAPMFPIEAVDPNIVSRTGAIGPEPAGPREFYALEYYKQLVPNAEVTLPGSTCDTCNPSTIAPEQTWTPQNLALLVERLGGAIVITHSQSGMMGLHMMRLLRERHRLDALKALINIEGGCSLTASGLTPADFEQVPYMVLRADYDYKPVRADCETTINAIRASPPEKTGRATAEYVKLDERGMHGGTHMMMLDKNNLAIADIILAWIREHVRNSDVR